MKASAGRPETPYFINAPVDFALIGGVSIVTFLLLRFFFSSERTSDLVTLSLQLAWVSNWPHASATCYRLYESQDNVRQYPMTALVLPWILVAGGAACFTSPELVAPAFVKLAILWAPFHFAGQSLGIALIYARRAGFELGGSARSALSAFLYGIFVAQAVRYETGLQLYDQYGLTYPSLGLPEWLGYGAQAWLVLSGLAVVILLARRCLAERRVVPPIVLLPVLTHCVWFLPGADWASFGEFVPFFHGLQYLLIAWSMHLKEKLDRGGATPCPRYAFSETARWSAVNLAGGGLLFWGLPQVMAYFGAPLLFSTGIVASAVQIHHYFVDGVIWKLRRTSVSSPLMAGLDELIGPTAPARTATA